jgi:hypothetical protein
MLQILFKNEADISGDWLFYIENEAKALAQREDFAIQNYVDREIFNPEVQKLLDSDAMEALLKDISGGKPLHLGLAEERKAKFLPDWLRPRFRKLKKKIKNTFCDVMQNAVKESDTKDLIKATILALIPSFGTGLPAAVLPILIGLLAYLLKHGIKKTCPLEKKKKEK